MSFSSTAKWALGLLAALLLFGCSRNGSLMYSPPGLVSAALQRSADGMHPSNPTPIARDACSTSRVYVADSTFGSSGSIQIYPQNDTNPAPCGTITKGINGPIGIYVDTGGTLYVANNVNKTITEYPRNQTAPSVTLNTAPLVPQNVFVGSDGTIYVVTYSRQADKVLEYARGAKSPTRTITIKRPVGAATDNQNNVYVSYKGTDGKGHVQKFKPNATTGKDLGISVGFSGDTKLTKKNELLLGDQYRYVVNVYPRGKTLPSRSIATPNTYPYHFVLNQAETRLYVAPFNAPVSIYDFQTGVQLGTITKGLREPSGVALDPPNAF